MEDEGTGMEEGGRRGKKDDPVSTREADIVESATIVNVPLEVARVELAGQERMKCKEEQLVMLC